MAPAQDEEDREKEFRGLFAGPEGGRRKIKWVSLLLLLVFLAVGGAIAWFTMKNAAHRLAGGDKARLASNSSLYGERGGLGRENAFFASEEELAKADPALRKALLERDGAAGAGPASGTASRPGAGGPAGRPAPACSAASASWRQPAAGRPGGPEPQPSRTSGVSGMYAGGLRSPASVQRAGYGGGSARSGKSGAGGLSIMDYLKSAMRTGASGARSLSRDASRNWSARAFDGMGNTGDALAYEGSMRAQLDRVNPDSVPMFLRDQNGEPGSPGGLSASRVAEPGKDEDGTEELRKEAEKKKEGDNQNNSYLLQMLSPLLGAMGKSFTAPPPPPAPPGAPDTGALGGTWTRNSDNSWTWTPDMEYYMSGAGTGTYYPEGGYGDDGGIYLPDSYYGGDAGQMGDFPDYEDLGYAFV